MQLTNIQNKAANIISGPCLVLAVPGAGKTTMLLERIKILSKITNPKRILTLTFSKTQSLDMKKRYGSEDSNFMTIHAFSYLILRNYLKKYHRQLRLLESDENYNKYHLVRDIYKDINNKKISREDLSNFFTEISFMKNAMLDESYLNKIRIKNVKKVFDRYENFKKSNSYIDFDDMQILALKLLEKDYNLVRSIHNKYDFFQLDEGQDTSFLQFQILRIIAAKNNNLMIVADDDQSIYSFRAADPSYLLNFSKHYQDGKIIIMNENHRSVSNITNLSGEFIKANIFRYKKEIISKKESGDKVIIKSLENSKDQYNFIIDNLSVDKTHAILFRNNISAINLVSYLLEDGIDFNISEDFLEFFNSQIIEDLFDIIDFSNDFNNTEAFINIYYKIKTYLKKSEIDKLDVKPINMDVFDFYYDKLDYDKKNILYDIEKKLKHIRKLDLDRKISYIYKYLGYREYALLRSNKFGEETMNKDLFVESLINFTKGLKDANDFNKKIEFLKKKIKFSYKSNLILQTIHKSKGLEYDKVFIIDLVKNEFPQIDYNKENSLEEERRIFYVAMTRAKENLFILTVKKRNNKKVLPSEFFIAVKNLK